MRRPTRSLVLAQVVLSAFLCGLIWVVQGVLYPLFTHVGPAEFPAYHAAEMSRITWIVAPAMLAELGLALTTLALHRHEPLAWATGALVGLLWLSTAFVQVPLHQYLAQRGADAAVISHLIDSNWIRTAGWTVRLALLLVWLRRLLRAPA
ncbi:MAG: hypothetical protein FJ382_06220 [Verrucomicrobia bacterium]|nr:hypothetical protein [Verrucomicrobiota bacterium]